MNAFNFMEGRPGHPTKMGRFVGVRGNTRVPKIEIPAPGYLHKVELSLSSALHQPHVPLRITLTSASPPGVFPVGSRLLYSTYNPLLSVGGACGYLYFDLTTGKPRELAHHGGMMGLSALYRVLCSSTTNELHYDVDRKFLNTHSPRMSTFDGLITMKNLKNVVFHPESFRYGPWCDLPTHDQRARQSAVSAIALKRPSIRVPIAASATANNELLLLYWDKRDLVVMGAILAKFKDIVTDLRQLKFMTLSLTLLALTSVSLRNSS
ncbi:hypothetical protein CPB84DRAFT_1828056 [Gymnopilus junonius]|uniref:Uncharacterized protein n=1 Tax=Gymnopilus junonius TaxID=109634 RepID=A0A9P5NC52_GYMJU|nr:hypothetical protein CPB84DRAFT_1828056 [Gymnopilus junonius]